METVLRWVFLVLVIALIAHVWRSWNKFVFPDSLPWAGTRKQIFSKTRACCREAFVHLNSMKSGYEKVSYLAQCL